MVISEKKTKAMIFNFSDNYQFTTRLKLKGQNIEVVDNMKILGTIINTRLTWDENCNTLIKKVNTRMQLLRGVHSFGASIEEMVHMWTVFCRSVLEQSCAVWHRSLTAENTEDLERPQKSFLKMILKDKYKNYDNALFLTNLESLHSRRNDLNLRFAEAGIKYDKLNDLLPTNVESHNMETRKTDKFKVNFANTERLKKSSIINMQRQLNEADKTRK